MKRFLVICISIVMITACVGCTSVSENTQLKYKVAMITDYNDITDESFNQAAYEGAKEFCESNSIDFTYYVPYGNSTADRVAMIDKAVAAGYNVIILPGSSFGEAIGQSADFYPDVNFIALDVAEKDLGYYKLSDNVFCAVYQEELAGFMAGFAAVELGYTHLGFLGGIALPPVVRYGYGFVQGADWAASIGSGREVDIKFAYGNQFYGDDDITSYVEKWYQEGVECVFSCGSGIYTSVAEAAAQEGGKVIGVDVDQAAIIDKYAKGMTVTSAMKGLGATVKTVLNDLCINNNWAEYGGKIITLGLVSGDNPDENYVQLPESTQWDDNGFNQAAYKNLVKQLYDGVIKVSDSIEEEPKVYVVAVDYQGNIK